jgi:carbon storage regulator
MLVLSRKSGQKIVVPECKVTITILEVQGNRVLVGVTAPTTTAVHREEVWKKLDGQSRSACSRLDVKLRMRDCV